MKLIHALTYTKPEARLSWKLLLYAVLCTLFGTACLFCLIFFMFEMGLGGKHPYDRIGMGIGLLVASVLFCVVAALWFYTLMGLSRKGRHILLSCAVVIVGFCPAFLLTGYICELGEQIGQYFLYG